MQGAVIVPLGRRHTLPMVSLPSSSWRRPSVDVGPDDGRHRRWRPRSAVIAVVVGVLALGSPTPAAGLIKGVDQSGLGGAGEGGGSLLGVGDPSSTLLAALNVLPIEGPGAERAEDGVRAVLADIDAAHTRANQALQDQRRLLAAGAELQLGAGRLKVDRAAAVAAGDRARQAAAEAAIELTMHGAHLEESRAVLETVAVQAYVIGNVIDPNKLGELTPALRRATYLDEVAAGQRSVARAERLAMDAAGAQQQAAQERASSHDRQRAATDADLAANAAAARRNQNELQSSRETQVAALAEAIRLGPVLVEVKEDLAAARRAGTITGTDLPLVVLDALVRAEARHAMDYPACHLSWTLLAALSRVESGHGDMGVGVDPLGATVHIFGPRLAPETGEGVAVVLDTDGGALDGDPLYDRAVGPMQFIPSSWQLYRRDGNGDGVSDPHNYYDAALAAGEHLCRPGQDTATASGRRAAVLGYNQSDPYERLVSGLAEDYAKLRW